MPNDRFANLTADQRDAVKWFGSIVLGVATAATGAATVARLGNVADGLRWVFPSILLLLAVGGIVVGATSIGWALAVGEPRLTDLAEKPSEQGSSRRGWWRPAELPIDKALAEAGAETELRRDGILGLVEQARVIEGRRHFILGEISAGTAGPGAHERLQNANAELDKLYSDMRNATSAVRYVWIRDRVRWALTVIGLSTAATIMVLIVVVLLTVPLPTKIASTAVRVYFTADTTFAKSPYGCIPAAVDSAWMTGGTWEEPILVFEPGSSAVTSAQSTKSRSGSCDNTQPAWTWYAASGQVVLTPKVT